MNVIDENARPYLMPMIKGDPVGLDATGREFVATWVAKVAVTARSASPNVLPIEKAWTDWLYNNRVIQPNWHASVGHYIGVEPFWYRPEDVSSTPPPDAPASWQSDPIFASHGVAAFLAVGHLAIEVLGFTNGILTQVAGPPETAMLDIWPQTGIAVEWPPAEHIDDAGLHLWARRFQSKPS